MKNNTRTTPGDSFTERTQRLEGTHHNHPPKLCDDNTWREWVDPYIIDSKRLITVRRNNLRFKHLAELDVDLVERKDGIQIRLANFDLDMHWRDALSEYADRHETHCTEFARTVLTRAEREDFLEQPGPTRQTFVEYLETGVDRDFRELF